MSPPLRWLMEGTPGARTHQGHGSSRVRSNCGAWLRIAFFKPGVGATLSSLIALIRALISDFGGVLTSPLSRGFLGGRFDLGRLRELYFERLEPNEPMIRHVAELRARGLRTALLTNNVREWEPLWRAKLPELDEIFELVVDSAFVGMRKPQPEIYELTLERLGDGLRGEHCLFLDDLDINCDTARALGMTAVRYESAEQAIAELESALETR